MAPRRLVLVLQDLLFGGTQRHALELAKRLDPSRYAPELWMLAGGDDFAGKAREAGIPLRYLSERRSVTAGAVLALRRAIAAERPALLMPLTAVPNIWARLFGRLSGVSAVVGTCRGGGAIIRQHERFLARSAHHHLVNTQALKQALLALGRRDGQVTVIPNGVDTEYFAPPPPERQPVRQVILCVARFVEDKDHQTLLAAFERAAPDIPEAELWLVGEGPLKPRLEMTLRRMSSRGRVRMYPGGADLRPFYQQAGVLALSSRREGLPNVILEGMASGLPVAATAVGGIPEVVRQGETGLLTPAGDPAGLARSLVALLTGEAARRAMGHAARRTAETEYSMEAMVRRHQEVLDRLG